MRTRLLILLSIVVVIASPARAQWQPNGLVLGAGDWSLLVPDGSGGAFVVWNDHDPYGQALWSYGMAQSVDAAGTKRWLPESGRILSQALEHGTPQVVSDGSGGAIFVWYDNRNGRFDIFAQRINAAGAEQWGAFGVPVRVLPNDFGNDDIVTQPDGSGGVIVTWADRRAGTFDMYSQHLNASGAPLWAVNGVPLCIAPDIQADPLGIADGLGGAWITWLDGRNGSIDIYARHINGAGPDGPATGLPICTAVGDQVPFEIDSDAAGGFIIAWEDRRTGAWDIYAQRMNLAGSVVWTANGAVVCTQAALQEYPNVASDGAGGAIVVWKDWRSPEYVAVYAQHLNAAGQRQWPTDGNLIGTSQQYDAMRLPVVISAGNGKSIVAWGKSDYDPQVSDMVPQLLVQRLAANGAPEWAQPAVVRGYTGFPADGGVEGIQLASDGWGGAIVAWHDWANWQASDVRIGHVSPGGVATDVTPARGPSLITVDVYPNPFSGAAKLTVEMGKPSRVEIDVFDVAGRKVRSFAPTAGSLKHVIDLTDRDDAGNILASGVYFCRVRAATGTMTRKIVITR